MLLSDWLLVVYLLFGATVAHQNFNRKRSHHPDRQTLSRVPYTKTYGSLRTDAQNKQNRLLLLTISPNWVTLRPQIIRRKLKHTEMQTLRRKISMRTITYNGFIEVDVKTTFVPKRVPEIMRSVINSNNYIKNRRAINEKETVKTPQDINSKDIETETDSASLDAKVLLRIQQLENELNTMKDQVNNDSVTIEHLKSKVIEKDRELAELTFINETLPVNKNTDTYKREVNMNSIDITDLTTQVITERTQRTEGMKHVGPIKNKPEKTDSVNLYVPNRISFRRNVKHTVLPSQKDNINNYSEGKYLNNNEYSDKRKNIVQKEHINDDKGNSENSKHSKEVIDRNNNQESGKKEINAENSIKEVTQDGNIFANKIENMAETKHPISDTFKDELDKKTRIEDALNIKDIDKIQFTKNKEYFDPPKTEDPEIDQLNPNDDRLIVKRRDFKTDYGGGPAQIMGIPEGHVVNEDGQLVPDENADKDDKNTDTGPFNNKKKNPFYNSAEYEKKLNDERIEGAIDWKTFNPSAFLAQISAELKEKTKMDTVDEEMSTIAPFNGRRMLLDTAINLTDVDDPSNADKLKTTPDMYAPAPPGQRKVALLSNMAVVIPPAPVEVKPHDSLLLFPSTAEDFQLTRAPLAPEAGKQKLTLDSTEDLVRNALRRFSFGKAHVPPSLDFDIYKQKLHRKDGKERKMLHKRVAEMMKSKISGRRSMNPVNIGNQYDISEEILKDPFLNDSFI